MNRLKDQTSPYLLQHAEDPINWNPWDEEALALAKSKNRPILLSIGYSANHLCQIMGHESFQSNQIAKLLNNHFVSILVDREERPDIDQTYQIAHRILSRSGGGWPLTVFLDPNDHLPFYSGTFFPAQANQEAPGFREVVQRMGETYRDQYDKIEEFKPRLRDAIEQALSGGASAELDPKLIDRACGQIDTSFDEKLGGFSEAPKVPHPPGLELLVDAAAIADSDEKFERANHMLDFTLAAMSRGGIFDQIGGGFFNRSTDAEWTIPSFEKLLCDNGLLMSLYARRAKQNGDKWLADVANQTARWVLGQMRSDDGGFCANQSADTERAEGKHYLWSIEEIQATVGDDETFAEYFGLQERPNFGRRRHLRLIAPSSDPAVSKDIPIDVLGPQRDRLLAVRNERELPQRDNKILTAWNALCVRGLAHTGALLNHPEYITAAGETIDHLAQHHWQNGKLLAAGGSGPNQPTGTLNDYAYLIEALLAMLSARWRDNDLRFSVQLVDAMLENFEDNDNGGLYFTAHDQHAPIHRVKAFADDPLPSANGIAALCLLELGNLTGEAKYLDTAERILRAAMTEVERWPSAHATLVRGLIDHTTPRTLVVLRSDDETESQKWIAAISGRALARTRSYVVPTACEFLPGRLAECAVQPGAATTGYIMNGNDRSGPITSFTDFCDRLA